MTTHEKSVGKTYKIEYYRRILDKEGVEIWRSPIKKNLITDAGLDQLGSQAICDLTSVGVIGTTALTTRRDTGGALTVSLAAGVLTASAGFFIPSDVGRIFKFNDGPGTEIRVTGYTSGTVAASSSAATIAANTGTMWYVELVNPAGETKRTSSYDTVSAGAQNGSTFSVNTWTHKRTFLFSAEVGTVTYRCVGWSNTVTANAQCFGVDQIPGTGDTLVATQQYSIVVIITVVYSPNTPTAVGNVGTGIDTSGTLCVEGADKTQRVNSNGTSGSASVLDFTVAQLCYALSSLTQSNMRTGSIPIFPYSQVSMALAAYVNGTYTRTQSGTFGLGAIGPATLIGLFCGDGVSLKLTTPFATLGTYTLNVVWRVRWQRVLTN